MSAIALESNEFKNCVILCSDLKELNKLAVGDTKSTGLINVPFYNTLTLGRDDHSMKSPQTYGEIRGGNFFRTLKQSQFNGDPEGFKSFMDILQMFIIQKIEANDRALASNYTKWTQSAAATAFTQNDAGPADGSYKVDFSWEDFLSTATTAEREEAQNRINLWDSPQGPDNLLLLRDYNSKADWRPGDTDHPAPLLIGADDADCLVVHDADSDEQIAYPTRDFNSVLEGKSCYNETILYKVDKSIVQNGAPTLVQTFYISARNGDWQQQEINYIDTQIKYGQKYIYNIKEIKLVYGNTYSYQNLKLYYSNIAPELSRGIGRALGIYRLPRQRWDGTSADLAGIHEVLDDIIKQAVDTSAYIPDTENPPVALEQTGYFIWRPGQALGLAAASWDGSLNEYQYKELFHVGTDFLAPTAPNNDTVADGGGSAGPLSTSTNPLDGIKMKVKKIAANPVFLEGQRFQAFANILQRPPASSSPVTINVTGGGPPAAGLVAGSNIVAGSQGRSSDEGPVIPPTLPPGVGN